MKPEKAKEILFNYVGTGQKAEPVDFNKACRLGAEALGAVLEMRNYPFPDGIVKLLSETED